MKCVQVSRRREAPTVWKLFLVLETHRIPSIGEIWLNRESLFLLLPESSLFGSRISRSELQRHECGTRLLWCFCGPKIREFPVFSPVSREFGGEGLALDCVLRHVVWVAEKLG
jgi:hypothetical protein